MEATTKYLRLHTRELMAAVARGEEVVITWRGEPRAKLVALGGGEAESSSLERPRNPAFGLWRDRDEDVDALVRSWREPRSFD